MSEQLRSLTRTRFTEDDAQRAFDTWGSNCGPGAIAAVMGMTLDEVRPHMGDFEKKRYTNPTLMLDALRSIGRPWRKMRAPLTVPSWGLVRVQWHGPWMKEGVPIAARYRHTHWIGGANRDGQMLAFDINCMNVGGWVTWENWGKILVPYLLKEAVPRADGKWSLTHVIEVDPPEVS